MFTVVSDIKGRMFNDREFYAVGLSGSMFLELKPEDVIPLPEGAGLVMLPGRSAVGINRFSGQFASIERMPVAATLPQGYTRLYMPAYTQKIDSPVLPLFGYTAVAEQGGQFFVAAAKTDDGDKWNPVHYNTHDLNSLVQRKLDRHPENRVLRQLAHCALKYGCFTAQNIFYTRWEGGIPVSPACNARCVGCISEQVSECCPSPQQRINFVPTSGEIADIAVEHLSLGEDSIISFGQGCEGEPTLQHRLLTEAVSMIREKCDKGIININTNGSRPEAVRGIIAAGLDGIRISTVGAVKGTYNAYYRPCGYRFDDVIETIKLCKQEDIFTSLNLLTFPGFTDTPCELEALCKLIEETSLDMVQFRNLNIDPRYFMDLMDVKEQAVGIAKMFGILKTEFQHLKLGNYTPYFIR